MGKIVKSPGNIPGNSASIGIEWEYAFPSDNFVILEGPTMKKLLSLILALTMGL